MHQNLKNINKRLTDTYFIINDVTIITMHKWNWDVLVRGKYSFFK